MDPVITSIVTLTAGATAIIGRLYSTGQTIKEIRDLWKNAPSLLRLLRSECRAVGTVLQVLKVECEKQRQQKEVGVQIDVSEPIQSIRDEMEATGDTLDDLQEWLMTMKQDTGAGGMNFRGHARMVWNDAKANVFLRHLEIHKSSLNLLISIIQLNNSGNTNLKLDQIQDAIGTLAKNNQEHVNLSRETAVFSESGESVYSAMTDYTRFSFDSEVLLSFAYRRLGISRSQANKRTAEIPTMIPEDASDDSSNTAKRTIRGEDRLSERTPVGGVSKKGMSVAEKRLNSVTQLHKERNLKGILEIYYPSGCNILYNFQNKHDRAGIIESCYAIIGLGSLDQAEQHIVGFIRAVELQLNATSRRSSSATALVITNNLLQFDAQLCILLAFVFGLQYREAEFKAVFLRLRNVRIDSPLDHDLLELLVLAIILDDRESNGSESKPQSSHNKSWRSKIATRLSSSRSTKSYYTVCGLVSLDNGFSLEIKEGICCNSSSSFEVVASNSSCRFSEKIRVQMVCLQSVGKIINAFNAKNEILSTQSKPGKIQIFGELFSNLKLTTWKSKTRTPVVNIPDYSDSDLQGFKRFECMRQYEEFLGQMIGDQFSVEENDPHVQEYFIVEHATILLGIVLLLVTGDGAPVTMKLHHENLLESAQAYLSRAWLLYFENPATQIRRVKMPDEVVELFYSADVDGERKPVPQSVQQSLLSLKKRNCLEQLSDWLNGFLLQNPEKEQIRKLDVVNSLKSQHWSSKVFNFTTTTEGQLEFEPREDFYVVENGFLLEVYFCLGNRLSWETIHRLVNEHETV